MENTKEEVVNQVDVPSLDHKSWFTLFRHTALFRFSRTFYGPEVEKGRTDSRESKIIHQVWFTAYPVALS